MPVIDHIAALTDEMTAWRRHLHTHPETAFEERATAAFVADRLESFGIKVDTGLAGTGVVGTLVAGEGPAVGLRAAIEAARPTTWTIGRSTRVRCTPAAMTGTWRCCWARPGISPRRGRFPAPCILFFSLRRKTKAAAG